MEEDNNLTPVETVTSQDSTLSVALRGMRGKVIFWLLIIAIGLFIVTAFMVFRGREEIVRSVPELKEAWIVSRLEGADVASDEPRTVGDGKGVMLFLVAYGFDRIAEENFYYTNSPADELPRVVIAGQEIPKEKLRRFEFYDTKSLVEWYKIEVSPFFFRDSSRDFNQRLYWTESRKHNMGDGWWAIADVRADLFTRYHYDFVGTMRYTANLTVFPERGPSTEIYSQVSTDGEDEIPPGSIPTGAHRVTMIPHYRDGLDATYRAFFNLMGYQDHSNGSSPAEMTRLFMGGDSKSILIGALRLLGYDAVYDDPLFLEKVADRVLDGITADEVANEQGISFFRKPDEPTQLLPIGDSGIMPGDVIVQGDRYVVFVGDGSSQGPQGGSFSNDDRVLDAYDSMVIETRARILEEEEAPFQIWRLRPLDSVDASKRQLAVVR